jgi:hypothetical protein
MSRASSLDPRVYGEDAQMWKGHRFLEENGVDLYKQVLFFGGGVSGAPRLSLTANART